jgi:hypothetical protein
MNPLIIFRPDLSLRGVYSEIPSSVRVKTEIQQCPLTIDSLIEIIQRKCFLIGTGAFDSSNHDEPSCQLKDKLLGWKLIDKQLAHKKEIHFLIVGAKRLEKTEKIYFIPVVGISEDSSDSQQSYSTSLSDSKVYVVSFEKFREHVRVLFSSAGKLKA